MTSLEEPPLRRGRERIRNYIREVQECEIRAMQQGDGLFLPPCDCVPGEAILNQLRTYTGTSEDLHVFRGFNGRLVVDKTRHMRSRQVHHELE